MVLRLKEHRVQTHPLFLSSQVILPLCLCLSQFSGIVHHLTDITFQLNV